MVEEGVQVMQRWGPWTHGKINKIEYEVPRYFRAYYAELRSLLSKHEDADLPYWFRGGREVEICLCTDGVLVVHSPFDQESMTYPERADLYKFRLSASVGLSVRELFSGWYNPPFPDGTRLTAMLEYSPGKDFGHVVRLWPAHEGYPTGEERIWAISPYGRGWTRPA